MATRQTTRLRASHPTALLGRDAETCTRPTTIVSGDRASRQCKKELPCLSLCDPDERRRDQ